MKLNNKKKGELKRIVAMLCAAVIALALILSLFIPVYAAPAQSSVDAAKKKTEQAKNNVEQAKDKREKAIMEYNSMDKQISDTEEEIGIIETQIENTRKDLEIKQKELDAAEKEYDEYEALFLERARIMYESGDIEYLEILFGSESFSDFISRMEIISQLMTYDQRILNKLDKIAKKIETAKNDIEKTLNSLEENKDTLNERKENLEENLLKKQELLKELEKDIEKYKAIYEEAERAEAEMIRQYQSEMSYGANPIKYTGGTFAWPVPSSGRITSQYGYRIHPVFGTRKFHSGIDIGAGYGVDILAAADGTVTLATTNGGYGKCIIINHGSGITTLYGHNSTLLVSKGDKVVRGQLIAKAGSTGVSTGPHLHFEVRVNGATTDPMRYLR